jgi:hypothetical protein
MDHHISGRQNNRLDTAEHALLVDIPFSMHISEIICWLIVRSEQFIEFIEHSRLCAYFSPTTSMPLLVAKCH